MWSVADGEGGTRACLHAFSAKHAFYRRFHISVSEHCVLWAFFNATVAGGAVVGVYDIDAVAFLNGIVWADISAMSALVADDK